MTKQNNCYETIILLKPDLSASQAENIVKELTNNANELGGRVISLTYCGLKTLAYIISKQKKAHYVQVNTKAPAEALQEMERVLKINESVMRFLTIKVEKHKDGPSVLLQNKGYSRNREGRYAVDESTLPEAVAEKVAEVSTEVVEEVLEAKEA